MIINMVNLCLALVALGIICLIIEMFFPDFGICGIIGLISLVVAAVLAVMHVPFGWLFVAVEVLLLAAVICFFFRYVRKKQLQGRLFMTETLAEDAPFVDDLGSFVGREGISVTSLRPFGKADFAGRQLDVVSEGQYIERGIRVKAVKVQDGKVFVRVVSESREN